MKALILTMQCGECHNTVAKSVSAALKERGVETKIVSIFESNPRLEKWNNNACLFFHKKFRRLYNFIWNIERKRNPKKRFKGISIAQIKSVLGHMKNVIDEFSPDFIVCTHNYASNIVSTLIYQGKIQKIPAFSFLLDYVVHPFWEDSILINTVFTPHESTHAGLIEKGFSPSQLEVSGFPINEKFYEAIEKHQARQTLKLEEKFTILSLGGGEGLTNQIGLIRAIKKCRNFSNMQILIVCGNNTKAKNKVEKYLLKNKIANVKVFGFVSFMRELICAADIVFSAAGGGTISEVLALKTPLILREKTTTNETFNKRTLVENGLGFGMNRPQDATKIIDNLISNPAAIANMQEKINQFFKPFGTLNAVAIMLEKVNSLNKVKLVNEVNKVNKP